MKIILPKYLVPRERQDGPLFFLLGPIRGGGDWQRTCCELLDQKLKGRCVIANPCRYGPGHPLFKYRVPGAEGFERQLSWERYYLSQASRFGCIIAWLPAESKTEPRTDGQPYATETRGELGEWRGRLFHGETDRFVLGAEPDFPGLDAIVRNFQEALWGNWTPPFTLEKTVEEAIGIAKVQNYAELRTLAVQVINRFDLANTGMVAEDYHSTRASLKEAIEDLRDLVNADEQRTILSAEQVK